jgi:carbonic anhydrase
MIPETRKCDTLVIRCMDHRLTDTVHLYIHTHCPDTKADEIAVQGGAKALLDPSGRGFVLEGIRLAASVHGVGRIVLTSHRDCGAYGGSGAFVSRQQEYDQHLLDLARAREVVLDAFRSELPGLDVRLAYAETEDGRYFQIVPIGPVPPRLA